MRLPPAPLAAVGPDGLARLLAIGPTYDGGSVHSTQKSPGLALTGQAEAGGRNYSLDGGVASYDFSNGLLGRRTAWRWISAHGERLGFNLQTGYFGAAENALWLEGALLPPGALEVVNCCWQAAACASTWGVSMVGCGQVRMGRATPSRGWPRTTAHAGKPQRPAFSGG